MSRLQPAGGLAWQSGAMVEDIKGGVQPLNFYRPAAGP